MGLLNRSRDDRTEAPDEGTVDLRDAPRDRPPADRREGRVGPDATTPPPRDGDRVDQTRVIDRDGDGRAEVVREEHHVDRDGDGRAEVVREEHRADVAHDESATTPTLVRERSWTFAPGQLVSMVVGGALVIVGTLALLRAGISEPLAEPVVQVLGLDHTAWLGLAELGVGLLLMLVGSGAWGRPFSVLLGAAMVVAGVLVVAESGAMPDELGLERGFGWLLIPLGALVAVAAMALPVWRNTHTNVRTLDLHGHDQAQREERRRFWRR